MSGGAGPGGQAADLAALVSALRAGVDPNEGGAGTQVLYEHWVKRDDWAARSEAIPLLVGVDPGRWTEYLREFDLERVEQGFWVAYAASLGAPDRDPGRIAPARLKAWAEAHGIAVPVCFGRLVDFVSRVLGARPDPPDPTALPDPRTAAPRDHEIVLGAALSIVAKMPHACRDEHGFFDGRRIARLIRDKAALWFEGAGPGLSESEMAALIERWLE